jgi:hypothetical protein
MYDTRLCYEWSTAGRLGYRIRSLHSFDHPNENMYPVRVYKYSIIHSSQCFFATLSPA